MNKINSAKLERVINHCNGKIADARKMPRSERLEASKIENRYSAIIGQAVSCQFLPNGEEHFQNYITEEMKPGNTEPTSPRYPVLAEIATLIA